MFFEKNSVEEIFVNQFVSLGTWQDKVVSSGPEVVTGFLDWWKKVRENMVSVGNEWIRI